MYTFSSQALRALFEELQYLYTIEGMKPKSFFSLIFSKVSACPSGQQEQPMMHWPPVRRWKDGLGVAGYFPPSMSKVSVEQLMMHYPPVRDRLRVASPNVSVEATKTFFVPSESFLFVTVIGRIKSIFECGTPGDFY